MSINIIVISLKHRHDRRERIQDRLASLGYGFDFFDACTAECMPDHIHGYFYDRNGRPWSNFMLPGEIGCYASHLSIMHDLAAGTLPSPLIVMEDDAEPGPEALPFFRKAYDLMSEDADRFQYINFYHRKIRSAVESVPFGKGVRLIRNYIPSFRTHCYMISRDGSKRFLSYKSRREIPIDEDLIHAALEGQMKVWEPSRSIVGYREAPVEENTIDPEGVRAGKLRHETLSLSYKRSLARQRYGHMHDFRYRLSKKIWKWRKRYRLP